MGDTYPQPVDTPYLTIRYDTTDMGQRPLPQGTVFWASPDISVSPTDANGNVQVGTNVTVQARVYNFGLAPGIPVNVEFYWVNPALGITPANGNLIGSVLVTVPATNYVDVTCPNTWTPTFVNGGHECLIVQCTCPQDPITNPFLPALDRHVGQRNITVAQPLHMQKLQLQLNNPFRSEQAFTLQLSSRLVQLDLQKWGKGDVALLTSLLANLQSPHRAPARAEEGLVLRVEDVTERDLHVRVVKKKEVSAPRIDEKRLDYDHYIHQRAIPHPETLGKVLGTFSLAPQLMAVVDIEIAPFELKNGEFIVHRLVQTAGGCEIGGYTVIVPSAEVKSLKMQ